MARIDAMFQAVIAALLLLALALGLVLLVSSGMSGPPSIAFGALLLGSLILNLVLLLRLKGRD